MTARSTALRSCRRLPGQACGRDRLLAARRERQIAPPLPPREEAQVMAGQRQDVFAPLAQRRQGQRDDVQAKEQVFAEPAGAHLVLQRAVGGGDHAHVGPAFLGFAQPLVGAVVEEAQQPGLGVGGQIAPPRRETACRPRPPRPCRPRRPTAPGERPLAMAEQRAAHQVARQHRAVDGDEGPAGPAALRCEPPRQHVLAGAALAAQQHDGVGGGGAGGGLQEGGVGGAARLEGALALGLVEPVLEFIDLPLAGRWRRRPAGRRCAPVRG